MGRVHEGNITFQAKFTHGGTIAEGSVRVWGEKMENGLGEPLTNCDSEPGETSAARGKPFKWRIVGRIISQPATALAHANREAALKAT